MVAEKNTKFTLPLEDNLAVEAVYYESGTLCLSSQAGCALGCPFCASGSAGLHRNLSLAEMTAQVETARQRGLHPRRITLSGIGEPLHNLQATLAFLPWCRQQGLEVSLTTTGHPLNRLSEILHLPHNGLMISLHAGTARTHKRVIPGGPPWEELWDLLAGEWAVLSRRRRRKVGINYLLLEGINDSTQELAALVEQLKPFPELTLHLLVCNPVPGSPFRSPSEEGICAAYELLRKAQVNVRRANRWRKMEEGGCGTLYVRHLAQARRA